MCIQLAGPYREFPFKKICILRRVCFGCGEISLDFFSFFFFERTRPAAVMMAPCLNYLSTSTGVRTACHYLISLSVCVCVTFVVFTDCESCTRRISTNPGSMEAGEYGLTRGTFYRALSGGGRSRRAAVDFVVCFGWGVFFRFFVFFRLCFLRTHTGCCKYEAPLLHLPLY